MTNDDLKRLYGINAIPQRNKDFVRYGENGEIITEHDATKNEEVVNYRTLIKHAGGVGADVNYRGAWTSGMSIKQYDVVYVNTFKTRQYYMASNDIASSTVAPNVDTDNYFLYLEVERNVQRDALPIAAEEYIDDIIQYIGETDSNFTNGYFYKCTRAITYYTIIAEDESITCYCAELPELGQRATLYTDTDLTIELAGKELLHITTGYDIVNTGESMGINTTQTPNIEYGWEQVNVQEGSTSSEVTASDVDSENATQGQVLTADGNGGASWENVGGGKLYKHIIYFNGYSTFCEIINNNSQTMTLIDVANFVFNNSPTHNYPILNTYVRPKRLRTHINAISQTTLALVNIQWDVSFDGTNVSLTMSEVGDTLSSNDVIDTVTEL